MNSRTHFLILPSLSLFVVVLESLQVQARRATLEAAVKETAWDKACQVSFAKYEQYCTTHLMVAFPPTYDSMSSFLLMLVEERKGSTASLHNDVSKVKMEAELRDLKWLSPGHRRRLNRLLAALRKGDVRAQRRAAAFRDSHLKQAIAKLDLTDPVQLSIACRLAVPKELLMRGGELAPKSWALTADHATWGVTSTGCRVLHLDLDRTKTHLSGGSVRVSVADYPHPHSAYKLLKAFYDKFHLSTQPSAPLFPRTHRGKLDWTKGCTYDSLRRLVKTTAASLGLDAALYSAHSLRAGGATDLFAAGLSYTLIKKAGRWKSDAAMLYYRSDEDVVLAVHKIYKRLVRAG